MQQGTDRHGRDHRGRQPGVHWHQRCLRDAKQVEHVDDHQQRAAGIRAEDAARDEVEGVCGDVGQDDRGQQERDGGAELVREVAPTCLDGLGRAGVSHEGIRDDRQHFVEQEQGDEVRGESDPDRGSHRQAQAGVEAGQHRLGRRPEVPHRVERREHPQDGCGAGEHDAEGVGT